MFKARPKRISVLAIFWLAAFAMIAVQPGCAATTYGEPAELHKLGSELMRLLHGKQDPKASGEGSSTRSNTQIRSSDTGKESNSQPASEWITVPAWLAGTWQADSQVILQSYNFMQRRHVIAQPYVIRISRQSVIGGKQDADGKFYHYVGKPYERRIDTDTYTEVQRIEKVILLPGGPPTVSVKCFALVKRIDKETQRLIDEFKEETVTTYLPLQDDLMVANFAVSDFDLAGNPTHRSFSMCLESRVQPLPPQEIEERRESRAMAAPRIASSARE